MRRNAGPVLLELTWLAFFSAAHCDFGRDTGPPMACVACRTLGSFGLLALLFSAHEGCAVVSIL